MKNRTLRIIAISTTLIAIIVAVTSGLCAFERHFTEAFTILEAKRPLAAAETNLTEVDALTIARSSLDAAGYPSQQWVAQKDDRCKPPEYCFVRNVNDPFGGWIMFENENRSDWYRELFVSFDRQGSTLHVRVYRSH